MRVHLVALTGSRQRPFLVVEAIDEFCRNGVAQLTVTQHLAGLGVA